MDLSNAQKFRIETLSEDIRLKCAKKLGHANYVSVIVQTRVSPNIAIDMFEIIDEKGLGGESDFIKSAIIEYIRKYKKTN